MPRLRRHLDVEATASLQALAYDQLDVGFAL